ncbi:hypothetical protein V8G54_024439 [Vigna mungo]|uniref:Flowering time control protein FY n=1 Tax=Vigna mungo TaxID=3915 RepID=A0AAQ3RSK1_VIGMU
MIQGLTGVVERLASSDRPHKDQDFVARAGLEDDRFVDGGSFQCSTKWRKLDIPVFGGDEAYGWTNRVLTGILQNPFWYQAGGKDNLVKLWDAKTGKELCSFHGHKNTVLCVKWNQNGNWVLTASKDQIIKSTNIHMYLDLQLYDIRAMKELESFRGHRKDVTALAWHPFHEEYFVSGSYDGSIFHWLVGGSSDHTTKFWCRNRPGDTLRDRFNPGMQGYADPNPVAGRVGGNFPMAEGPTTPGPFVPGLNRNEGTIPGVGVAMPLSIPSLDMPQGEQKQPHPVSMGAPPLPPGPHPSLLNANQQQPYQQNPQQMPPQHQHQGLPQQMGPLPMPPNMPQLQHPSHSPMVPHQHLPRPPPQMPIGLPGSIPGISSVPTSHPMPMPGPMIVECCITGGCIGLDIDVFVDIS